MRTQPSMTRDYFMSRARQARTYLSQHDAAVFGVIQVWKPVAHYVAQARRANRQHVQNLKWSRG